MADESGRKWVILVLVLAGIALALAPAAFGPSFGKASSGSKGADSRRAKAAPVNIGNPGVLIITEEAGGLTWIRGEGSGEKVRDHVLAHAEGYKQKISGAAAKKYGLKESEKKAFSAAGRKKYLVVEYGLFQPLKLGQQNIRYYLEYSFAAGSSKGKKGKKYKWKAKKVRSNVCTVTVKLTGEADNFSADPARNKYSSWRPDSVSFHVPSRYAGRIHTGPAAAGSMAAGSGVDASADVGTLDAWINHIESNGSPMAGEPLLREIGEHKIYGFRLVSPRASGFGYNLSGCRIYDPDRHEYIDGLTVKVRVTGIVLSKDDFYSKRYPNGGYIFMRSDMPYPVIRMVGMARCRISMEVYRDGQPFRFSSPVNIGDIDYGQSVRVSGSQGSRVLYRFLDPRTNLAYTDGRVRQRDPAVHAGIPEDGFSVILADTYRVDFDYGSGARTGKRGLISAYETGSYSFFSTYDQAMFEPVPPPPFKGVSRDARRSPVADREIRLKNNGFEKTWFFYVSQPISEGYSEKWRFSEFVIRDRLEDLLEPAGTLTEAVRIFDIDKNDVTASFRISHSGQTIEASAKKSALEEARFYHSDGAGTGQRAEYIMRIQVRVKENWKKPGKYARWQQEENGHDILVIPNVADVTILDQAGSSAGGVNAAEERGGDGYFRRSDQTTNSGNQAARTILHLKDLGGSWGSEPLFARFISHEPDSWIRESCLSENSIWRTGPFRNRVETSFRAAEADDRMAEKLGKGADEKAKREAESYFSTGAWAEGAPGLTTLQ